MPTMEVGHVLHHKRVGPGIYYLQIKAVSIAREAEPGQFVHVRCTQGTDPLLRRPFSLHEIDSDRGIISLLYQVRGKGTKWLTGHQANDPVDLMGPLGRGFRIVDGISKAILVGGGIGMAPLLPLAQAFRSKGVEVLAFLGAASRGGLRGGLVRLEAYETSTTFLGLATDDGSMGYHGVVTDLLPTHLEKGGTAVYACGPDGMMRAVAQLAAKYNVPCQVSLDKYMACGAGACMGCVCKRKDSRGEITYARVCTEGPVFDAREVYF